MIVKLLLTDISEVISKLPTDCFDSGAKYHIHTNWNYDDSNDRSGADDCGYNYTGNHWDPWVACSNSTGNEYCLKFPRDFADKCVKSSSAYTTSGNYTCNSTVYATNPFACEVSDFSGKYGRLYFTNNISKRTDTSFWEVKSSDVYFKSIVFHCGKSGERAFCAPFNTEGDTSNFSITQSSQSMKASFGGNLQDSYIQLKDDGSYDINIDFSKIVINSICINTIAYRIYDSWNGSESAYIGNENCSKIVGKVYDPTVSCLSGSNSQFCENTYRCNDTSYTYNCSAEYDRYDCSPSDLSGKYGILKIRNSTVKFSKTGTDELMIPMNLIVNKSIVLECADSFKIACAQLIETSSSNSSANQLSKTDIILIVVFFCHWYYNIDCWNILYLPEDSF